MSHLEESMKFTPLDLTGLLIIEPQVFEDVRGFFMESWRADQFAQQGLNVAFVQDNHSRSQRGVLRGLHYQVQRPQGKLVRVVQGEVYDVAVDLRAGSPTYGQARGVLLSSSNRRMFWIPPGFAHGFYVLSETAESLYKCSDYYAPEHERCLLWSDPALAIDWPLLEGRLPLLSEKDRKGLPLALAEPCRIGEGRV